MINYDPMGGDVVTGTIRYKPRHCFLVTQLGEPISPEVIKIRDAVTEVCKRFYFTVHDASTQITGRDLLLKIWRQIVASPLVVGVYHEDIPQSTLSNIVYELGVAHAMGKECLLIKSTGMDIPSDLVRTEYIEFNANFSKSFSTYLDGLSDQAKRYELMASKFESNPIESIDYLKRAFLISGNIALKQKARVVLSRISWKGGAVDVHDWCRVDVDAKKKQRRRMRSPKQKRKLTYHEVQRLRDKSFGPKIENYILNSGLRIRNN